MATAASDVLLRAPPDTRADPRLSGAIYTRAATAAGVAPNMALLALTGWYRDSYTASPWTPTASAGTSGANGNLAEATNPPATLSVLGYGTADFDGVNDQLSNATLCQSFISDAAGWIGCLFYADTAVADPGTTAYYLGAGLLTDDTSGQIGLTFSAGGLYFGCSNGGDFDAVAAACSTGAWHVGQARWNSTTIEVRVDAGAWQTLARVVVTSAVDGIRVGINYDQTVPFDGRVRELLTAQFRASDTQSDDFGTYVQDRYGLSLGFPTVAAAVAPVVTDPMMMAYVYASLADVWLYAGPTDAPAVTAYSLACLAGSYSYTGQAAGLTKQSQLATVAGAYAYTGQVTGVAAGRFLSATTGTYNYTGQVAGLTYAPSGGGSPYTLVCTLGTYALTGQTAGVAAQRQLATVAGSYTLTGQTAGVAAARQLTTVAGAYTYTGQVAGLAAARKLAAATGTYALTGQAAALTAARKLTAISGGYTYTGQAAAFARARTLACVSGSYAYTGQTAGVAAQRQLVATSGAYALTGSVITFTSVGVPVPILTLSGVVSVLGTRHATITGPVTQSGTVSLLTARGTRVVRYVTQDGTIVLLATRKGPVL